MFLTTNEFLRRRAEAHAAACAELDSDYLIQVAFAKPKALEPIKSTMLYQPGALSQRQAD